MEALVKLLEGAEDAFVAKGALGAISSLVQGNPTNKIAVREANGIEVECRDIQSCMKKCCRQTYRAGWPIEENVALYLMIKEPASQLLLALLVALGFEGTSSESCKG